MLGGGHFGGSAGEPGAFRTKVLVGSALVHLLLGGLLVWAPVWPTDSMPAVIAVDLVAAPMSGSPAPAMKPAPKPTPEPAAKPKPAPAKPAPPKPPKPAPVVLPTEASKPTPKKPKPEPAEVEPEPVKKPEPEPEPEPAQEDYADVMSQLRAELGEKSPVPGSGSSRNPLLGISPGAASGGARSVSPEVAAWMRDARVHIRRSWVVPPGFRNQSLQTFVEVELDAAGNVIGEPVLMQRSGNPWYDDGVVRSIAKSSPLPPPPQAGRWSFVMLSDEM